MESSNPYPVTVVVIAHNEEEHIERCLSSVADWVEEIIVVVNDCTDHTVTKAQALGAKVVEHVWQGYGAQKNFGAALASRPWILFLDADEEVSSKLRVALQHFLLENNPIYVGASFSRRVFFQKKWIRHGEWYPDYVLRLNRKKKGHWSDAVVHEQLELKGKVKRLDGHLYHYTYRSFQEQVQTGLKYSDLWVENHSPCKVWTLEIFARSFWRFFRGYVVKLGFLDGFLGLYIALTQAFFAMYRYTRLREHYGTRR
jgi:glycosyltransferase involved in cell wall biosynthesis